jgi:RHS repeat-associated protein
MDQHDNKIASYQYDPFGRRIRKTIHRRWNGTVWEALAQQETHTYVYADEGLSAEYKTEGTNPPQLIAEYGWEPDGIWGTNPVWIRTMWLVDNTAGNANDEAGLETFFYQNDHLGTPLLIIDQVGNIVWSQKSTVFGETTVNEASTIKNNLRFPGQYFDAETNTHYNFFRDYSPKTGRYRQRDPVGLASGANVYVYPNNPILDFDPSGLLKYHSTVNWNEYSTDDPNYQSRRIAYTRWSDQEMKAKCVFKTECNKWVLDEFEVVVNIIAAIPREGSPIYSGTCTWEFAKRAESEHVDDLKAGIRESISSLGLKEIELKRKEYLLKRECELQSYQDAFIAWQQPLDNAMKETARWDRPGGEHYCEK